MNELIYEISERCKEVTIKDFKAHARLGQEDMFRLIRRNKFCNKATTENLIAWLDNKIRILVKYKLRAEKLLNTYKE